MHPQMSHSRYHRKITIPESEIRFTFSRSGGAGGQNINKVETKAAAYWDFRKSATLNDTQKELLARKLAGKINDAGEVTVASQEERSQLANRNKAVLILNALVSRALTVAPKRTKTKVPRREKMKRLEHKRRVSEKKQARRAVRE